MVESEEVAVKVVLMDEDMEEEEIEELSKHMGLIREEAVSVNNYNALLTRK